MAQLFKKNDKIVAPAFKNGVSLQFFTITFTGADLTAKLGSDEAGFLAGTYTADQAKSPVAKALENIQARVSIEIIGTPRYASSDTTLVIGVAAIGGDYPTDNYDGSAGTESMATYLTALVRDGKTYQGFAMSGAAVAADVRGVAL
jgi:hypothetical protein